MSIDSISNKPNPTTQGASHDPNRESGSLEAARALRVYPSGLTGVLRPQVGISSAQTNEGRTTGEVHTGSDASWPTSLSHRSRLTFPLRVKIAVAGGSALFVATMWLLGRLTVYLVGLVLHVSHLSGFWPLVLCVAAYLIFCFFLFSLVRIAGASDRRAAEMRGGKMTAYEVNVSASISPSETGGGAMTCIHQRPLEGRPLISE